MTCRVLSARRCETYARPDLERHARRIGMGWIVRCSEPDRVRLRRAETRRGWLRHVAGEVRGVAPHRAAPGGLVRDAVCRAAAGLTGRLEDRPGRIPRS